jgi:hypothetical protein
MRASLTSWQAQTCGLRAATACGGVRWRPAARGRRRRRPPCCSRSSTQPWAVSLPASRRPAALPPSASAWRGAGRRVRRHNAAPGRRPGPAGVRSRARQFGPPGRLAAARNSTPTCGCGLAAEGHALAKPKCAELMRSASRRPAPGRPAARRRQPPARAVGTFHAHGRVFEFGLVRLRAGGAAGQRVDAQPAAPAQVFGPPVHGDEGLRGRHRFAGRTGSTSAPWRELTRTRSPCASGGVPVPAGASPPRARWRGQTAGPGCRCGSCHATGHAGGRWSATPGNARHALGRAAPGGCREAGLAIGGGKAAVGVQAGGGSGGALRHGATAAAACPALRNSGP